MYSVSDHFLERVRDSGERVTFADLYLNREIYRENIPVISGSLTMDRKANIRKSGSMAIGDNSLINLWLNQLSPYNFTVVIKQGVVFPNRDMELVPFGTFTIEEVTWSESQGVPEIKFYDYGKSLEQTTHFFTVDYSGSFVRQRIEELVAYTIPWATVVIDSSLPDVMLPGGTTYDGNHLESLAKLTEAIGAEGFFDRDDVYRVVPIPSVNIDTGEDDSVWDVDVSIDGSPGVLVSADRSITKEGVFNGVSVVGATPEGAPEGTVVVGHAFDLNPASPTYWNGPFGRRTKRIENSALTDNGACRASAEAQLRNFLGLTRSLNFEIVANPALDPGDIVKVIYLDESFEYHLIDSLSIPLGTGAFTAQTRAKQYIGTSTLI